MPSLVLVLNVHVNLNNRNVNAVSYCVGDMLIEYSTFFTHLVGEYAGHEVNMGGLTNETMFHD